MQKLNKNKQCVKSSLIKCQTMPTRRMLFDTNKGLTFIFPIHKEYCRFGVMLDHTNLTIYAHLLPPKNVPKLA